jgi:predicted small metal-binding protein
MAQENRPSSGSSTGSASGGSSSGSSGSGSSSSSSSSKPVGRESGGSSGDLSLRCKDAGFQNCPWETRGSNEDEIMRNAERHGREQHNISNFDDDTRNKVRGAIRRQAA